MLKKVLLTSAFFTLAAVPMFASYYTDTVSAEQDPFVQYEVSAPVPDSNSYGSSTSADPIEIDALLASSYSSSFSESSSSSSTSYEYYESGQSSDYFTPLFEADSYISDDTGFVAYVGDDYQSVQLDNLLAYSVGDSLENSDGSFEGASYGSFETSYGSSVEEVTYSQDEYLA